MKKLYFLIAMIMVLTIFNGCKKSPEIEVAIAANTPEEKSNNDSIIKLNMLALDFPQQSRRIDIYEKAKVKYEADHPNVKINIERIQYDKYRERLKQDFEAGTSPDLINIANPDLAQLYRNQQLISLNQFERLDNFKFEERLYKAMLNHTTSDGEIYAVPTFGDPYVIFYNKNWFDKAKLAYPQEGWTWEQFIVIARKLMVANAEGDSNKFGAAINIHPDPVEVLTIGMGGSYLSSDGLQSKGYLDSDISSKAFKWLVDLVNVQKVAPYTEDPLRYFTNGQVGMTMQFYYGLTEIQGSLGDRFGVVGLPKFEAGKKVNTGFSYGIGISAQSKNVPAAWDFLKQIAVETNEFTKELGSNEFIAIREVIDGSGILEDPVLSVFSNEMEFSEKSSFYMNGRWESFVPELTSAFRDAFKSKGDIKQMLTSESKNADLKLKSEN
ncbi:sugar ABC transporter substrate-binding protein [Paenibacillus psychroresistens]|uniref:Sugar ABC transporter substrate-binding protein n=1 Tax=Paenibacillus psychroresistens TaxID=1778678 RepID=A0A6B8RMJ6_9BACL|nr:sugar ABC transporter substrate-binding protein [Paenibacillus psychroresistens]QGQ96578.1 sugar ABC transporter substrate-binding protein [Paenibacillus psychroresistens]